MHEAGLVTTKGEANVTELARRLDANRVDDVRRNIYRWFKTGGIENEWAERLAAAVGKPPDYFKAPAGLPPSERARLRALAEEMIAMLDKIELREAAADR